MRDSWITVLIVGALFFAGCDKESTSPGPQAAPPPSSGARGTETAPAAAKAGAPATSPAGHHLDVIELGTTKIGELTVRASRDKAAIIPGGDAPIDVWLTTASGQPAKVTAVRFWIGTEDAKGSVKTKADIEDPKEPNHWHTHGEVPDPLPNGSKLWVEVEDSGGRKAAGGFDLKA